jgi:7,8-dihydro-6-hydroxymethylpterin-pyrophosphokinase
MSSDHGDVSGGVRKVTIEAAFGLRAFHGSREALLRAAFDLIDTTPGIQVRRRSFVWRCPSPVDYLCAAVGVTADHRTIEELAATARGLEEWLGGGATGPAAPLVIDLLWAHDPQGKPTPPEPHPPALPFPPNAPAAVARAEQPPPPLPPGRILVHPEARTRASACGPLSEVAPDAQDPNTGRYLAENLYTVPEPYIEQPRPFTPSFRVDTQGFDGYRVHTLESGDRADLLAAAAEAFGRAQPSGEPVGPSTIVPTAAYAASVEIPPGSDDSLRVHFWLHAVHAAMERDRVRLRRAVVLADGATVQGLLFGLPGDDPPELGRPHRADVKYDAVAGRWHAELTIADR